MNEVRTSLPEPGAAEAFYVVDISGYLFRAYHALPPLSNPKGEPTHAVLGVVTMLLKLIEERKPAHLAIALDSPGPSFRRELYDGYKANRPPAPEDLRQQAERLGQIVSAYRIATFGQPGVEADDVIASLTRVAREQGLSVVIVSSDKDLMQLVGEGVLVYDTARNNVFGREETQQKLGVPPEQVRDLLALTGDSSDNIPGVPSVGPKTAAQLLQQFGSLDGIYEHVGEISRKGLREKLQQHREQAYLSRDLVTLKFDVPLEEFSPAGVRLPEPDLARLRQLFEELDFTRLLTQLKAHDGGAAAGVASQPAPEDPNAASSEPRAPVPREWPKCSVVADEAALATLARELEAADEFALMSLFEAGHPVSGTLVGLGFGLPGRSFYVPLGHVYLACPSQLPADAVLSTLRGVVEDRTRAKLCADSKREMMVLAASGVALGGVTFDLMLASYLLDPERHAHRLHDIARFELDWDLSAHKALGESRVATGTFSEETIEHTAAGLGEALHVLSAGRRALEPRLEQKRALSLLHDMELPLAAVLARMELTGVRVDALHLRRLAQQVAEQLVGLEQRCRELAGHDFNVGSPRQLETILFDELELPVIKRTKTARSTDQSVLEELALHHELPAAILEHRMLAKLKSTYLDALPREVNPKTGRIHTDFRQAVAATGRLSSSDPNLQNIPIRSELGRSIRDAFVAREGWSVFSADYSQIELRVLAHLSHDAVLTDAFAQGADVHVKTARAIFGVEEAAVTREMRGQAKTVNFAVIYGQTQFALARNLRIERSEASRYIKAFFEQYRGVREYMERVVAEATERGYVSTLLGRRRELPDLRSRNRVKRQAAERIARNTPIQGTAADIIKRAMIAVDRELEAQRLQSRMLLSVHDELVFEAPPDEQQRLETLVCSAMEAALALDVPLVVDRGWGHTWGEAH